MEKIYLVVHELPDWPAEHFVYKNKQDAHNKAMAIFGDYVHYHMTEGIFETNSEKIEFFDRFKFVNEDDTGFIKEITIKEAENQYEEIYIEEVELQ